MSIPSLPTFARRLVGAAAVALPLLTASSFGSLTYQLELLSGGQEGNVSSSTTQVQLALYAIITGSAGNAGFFSGAVSVLSDNGGSISGNLVGTLNSALTGNTSSSGLSQDIDGDGDKDVGAIPGSTHFNLTSQVTTDFFYPRSPQGAYTTAAASPNTDPNKFLLGTFNFNITSVSGSSDFHLFAQAPTFAKATDGVEALWRENGGTVSSNDAGAVYGTAAANAQVILHVIPEPSSMVLLGAGLAACGVSRFRRRSA